VPSYSPPSTQSPPTTFIPLSSTQDDYSIELNLIPDTPPTLSRRRPAPPVRLPPVSARASFLIGRSLAQYGDEGCLPLSPAEDEGPESLTEGTTGQPGLSGMGECAESSVCSSTPVIAGQVCPVALMGSIPWDNRVCSRYFVMTSLIPSTYDYHGYG